MAAEKNSPEVQPMDPELFKKLDEGLRTVFDWNVQHAQTLASWHQTNGLAAAESAKALIELHTRCKPR